MYDKNFLDKLKKEKENWNDKVKNQKERNVKFETDSGIPVKPLYTPLDVKGDYFNKIGFPGQPPYSRGVYPNMYRGRLWTMRLFSGHGTPEETNLRWKYLYENGETGFSAAVDALTFNGIDPTNRDGAPEVGTSGVPLYCIDSLFALTEEIPIDKRKTPPLHSDSWFPPCDNIAPDPPPTLYSIRYGWKLPPIRKN